ncbi:TPA: heavy-metal-associated domain-containing protein [Staphylococcus pseudintermedius]|nr:heavy-metal-associated domain-containing protein [Staphylococcus pseudintermedius]
MENGYVKVTQLTTEAQQQQLSDRLLRLIGVESVAIDVATQSLTLTYDTPANLNTIEKEIYDAGFPVIQSYKGV